MIYVAINHITAQLNQFLRRSFDLQEDIVVTSNLVELDGTVSPQTNNKIIVSLVNVEKDTAPRQVPGRPSVGGNRVVQTTPSLYLNLYLIVAGHFAGNNYAEALKFLSTTIGFFHRRPVFDHATTPELDRRIERLTLELENLDIQGLSNLWGVIGGKYLPSVLYKIRMIVIDSDDVIVQTPALHAPHSEVAS